MHTQKEFHLGLLGKEEEWRLFEKILNKGDDPAEFLANNRDLAKEVANKCGGLPLLIQKVATDLRINKQLYTWKVMLKQLKSMEGTEIYELVGKVFESSYKNLKDEEAKSIFLVCPLFGNSNIRIQDLLIFCTVLHLFKHVDSIEESRDRVLFLIDKLKNESLLLDADKAGFVKIHDVVRDVAAAIALKEHCAFVGKGVIKSTDLERKDCTRISLPYCEIPELPVVLQCPEAEVFSLFKEDLSLHIPDSFFEGVTKLKVLHFTGLSFVSGLPTSLSLLKGLQMLSLNGCNLNKVAMIAELEQLEILSFAGSNIAQLPREIKALTRLKLLDLTGCCNLRVIPSNVLSNLHFLEELYVLNSFDGWDTEGNARLVELKNLSRLKTLEIKVKDDKVLPQDWFFKGIQNYKIIIGHWDWSDALGTSRMLMLELKTSIGLMDGIKEFLGEAEVLYLREVNGIENLSRDSSMEKMNSFQRLRLLDIQDCDSLREVLPFSKCLRYLQEMEVGYCSNIEAIVGEGNEDEVMKMTQLTSLRLWCLPHLRGISKTSGTVSFPNLTNLGIYNCDSLKYVFTVPIVKSLLQLKRLYIRCCNSMEEIIHVTKFEEVAENNINMIAFPELDFLKLEFLPSLKRFSSGYRIEFPKLRELHIMTSGEINESSDEYLFNDMVIPNMEVLTLDHHGLKAIQSDHHGFPNESLWKLKEFTLRNLEQETVPVLFDFLRRIYSVEKLTFKGGYLGEILSLLDGRAVGDQEQQYHLGPKHLDLIDVSKMKHIVKKDSKLNPISECFQTLSIFQCYDMMNIATSSVSFATLTTLCVVMCDNMTSLVTASTAKSMIHLMELQVSYCGMMEGIIVAKEEGDCTGEHDDEIIFNNLKRLELIDLPSLNSFCSGNYIFNFPLLEQLVIEGCNQMQNFCRGEVSTPKLQGEGNVNAITARQIQEERSVDSFEM